MKKLYACDRPDGCKCAGFFRQRRRHVRPWRLQGLRSRRGVGRLLRWRERRLRLGHKRSACLRRNAMPVQGTAHLAGFRLRAGLEADRSATISKAPDLLSFLASRPILRLRRSWAKVQMRTSLQVEARGAWNRARPCWLCDGSRACLRHWRSGLRLRGQRSRHPSGATYVNNPNTIATGYVLGGGLEYKVKRDLSLKVEYQYVNLGKNDLVDVNNKL